MSIASLRQQIREADAAYRSGAPLMTDAEFDALVKELRTVAPHAPELLTPGGGTALLSLHNEDPDEFIDWHAQLPSPGVIVQPKIDGVALGLRYIDGTLVAAWTRSGKCALQVAKLVRSIPKTIQVLPGLTADGVVEVHGELYGLDFKQSTPAAALRRKQPSGEGLAFTAYRLQAPPLPTELASQAALARFGFDCPDTLLCTKPQEVLALHSRWLSGDLFISWPTDGIVIKALSHLDQARLGATALAPRWALALKR